MYELQRLIDVRKAENGRGKLLVAVPHGFEQRIVPAIAKLKKWTVMTPLRLGDGALLASGQNMRFVRGATVDRAPMECLARGCFDAGFVDEDIPQRAEHLLYLVRQWSLSEVDLRFVANIHLGSDQREHLRHFTLLLNFPTPESDKEIERVLDAMGPFGGAFH